MKTLLILSVPCLFFLGGPTRAAVYDVIRAPGSVTSVEGNSSLSPLDTAPFPARFQQVYDSSLFSGYLQGLSIGEVVFRVDGISGHAFVSTVSDIEVHFSTTSRAVDSLSPVFDLNVGADDRMVVGRGPITLVGSPGGPGILPSFSIAFDIRSNPFYYNASSGNLLMDIKVFTGASTSPFDAVDVSSDTVSSVFAYAGSIPSSGQASSLGLATQFAVQAVPEPSSLALLVFGALVMALAAREQLLKKG